MFYTLEITGRDNLALAQSNSLAVCFEIGCFPSIFGIQ